MSISFLGKRTRSRRIYAHCRRFRFVTWTIAVAAVLWGLSLVVLLEFVDVRRPILPSVEETSFRESALHNHVSQIRWPPSSNISVQPDGRGSNNSTWRDDHMDGLRAFGRSSSSSSSLQHCANATTQQKACTNQRHHCPLPAAAATQPPHNDVMYPTQQPQQPHHCRTLWWSGFHAGPASQCTARGIRMEYAAALSSARQFVDDGVLQPVLVVGRLGRHDDDDNAAALQAWALEQGAIVVTVDRLSIQDLIAEWHAEDTSIGPQHLMGPYLRMDIPWIIEKYKLFDLPGVCDRHVLYTDSDSLFVNRVQHKDMELLKNTLQNRLFDSSTPFLTRFWKRMWAIEPPYLLYGREGLLHSRTPKNTGVMLMDVPRFAQELPAILRFRNEHTEPSLFQAFDQGLLNMYFAQSFRMELGRHMLPLYWNWKLYWPLRDATELDDVLLVHFHGPKLHQGAREMADCEIQHLGPSTPPQYRGMIERGVCCNGGSTAAAALELFHYLKPKEQEVC